MTKNIWPIGLTIVFIVFFLYLIGFIILSQMNRTELVTEDYYEEEVVYQDQIDRIEHSKALDQSIKLIHDDSNQRIELQFPSQFITDSIAGSILFFRPSDAKQDKVHPIRLNDAGMQILDIKNLSKGMWRVKIFWQVGRVEYYDEKKLLIK